MSPVAVGRLCVFCHRQPAQPPWEPFCSERCKVQDLARWIDGAYRVPGESVPQQPESDSTPRANDDDGDR
jgi:endogenous inhibitor of DNA gyrase (YacG/DUF329 family)